MKTVSPALLALALATPVVHSSETIISEPTLESLLQTQRIGMPSTETMTRELCVAKGKCFEFQFVVSSKGNGILSFPGGWIRIYDSHAEDDEAPPGLLANELVDVNDDGFKDLRTALVTFNFDPKQNCFIPSTDPIVPITFSRAPCDGTNE